LPQPTYAFEKVIRYTATLLAKNVTRYFWLKRLYQENNIFSITSRNYYIKIVPETMSCIIFYPTIHA